MPDMLTNEQKAVIDRLERLEQQLQTEFEVLNNKLSEVRDAINELKDSIMNITHDVAEVD